MVALYLFVEHVLYMRTKDESKICDALEVWEVLHLWVQKG